MKSKPWFSSRTARPASNWTRSSLQLRCPKLPQTPRTIFTLPSPVTVCSPKTLPATTLTWKRLPAPSSTPRARPRVLKLHTALRNEPPRCSAVAMAPCLPGIQVWNLLSLQEMTSVKKDRRGKIAVSPMAERTRRHSWQGAGSTLTERRLSNQRRQPRWSTSREQPGMSAVFARGKCKIFWGLKSCLLVGNVLRQLEKSHIFSVLLAAPAMFWHPGPRDRNSGPKRPKLDGIHLKPQSTWRNLVSSENLPNSLPRRVQTPRNRYCSPCCSCSPCINAEER